MYISVKPINNQPREVVIKIDKKKNEATITKITIPKESYMR